MQNEHFKKRKVVFLASLPVFTGFLRHSAPRSSLSALILQLFLTLNRPQCLPYFLRWLTGASRRGTVSAGANVSVVSDCGATGSATEAVVTEPLGINPFDCFTW